MNRLNNAVAQRNAAREEALMLEAKLKQLQVGAGWNAAFGCVAGKVDRASLSECRWPVLVLPCTTNCLCLHPTNVPPASVLVQDDMQSGRLAPVAAAGAAAGAAAAAASAGMVTPPPATAAAAGDEGMMDRMRRFMQQIPGTSPMGTPMATPSGRWRHWLAEERPLRGWSAAPMRIMWACLQDHGALLFVLLNLPQHTPSNPRASPTILSSPGRLEGPSTEPLSEMDRRQRELYAKQQQLLREQRTADQEKLLAAIGGNLGFHAGRPVAATTIFRCCLQWKTFQADRTPLFDRIIATMGSQVGWRHRPGMMGGREAAAGCMLCDMFDLHPTLLLKNAGSSSPAPPPFHLPLPGGAAPGGQRHAGLLAVQHRHAALPDAKEREARQRRRLRGAHQGLRPAGADCRWKDALSGWLGCLAVLLLVACWPAAHLASATRASFHCAGHARPVWQQQGQLHLLLHPHRLRRRLARPGHGGVHPRRRHGRLPPGAAAGW